MFSLPSVYSETFGTPKSDLSPYKQICLISELLMLMFDSLFTVYSLNYSTGTNRNETVCEFFCCWPCIRWKYYVIDCIYLIKKYSTNSYIVFYLYIFYFNILSNVNLIKNILKILISPTFDRHCRIAYNLILQCPSNQSQRVQNNMVTSQYFLKQQYLGLNCENSSITIHLISLLCLYADHRDGAVCVRLSAGLSRLPSHQSHPLSST